MTSDRYNRMKAFAAEEMRIFDALPQRIREAMQASKTSVRSRIVLDALLRGASEDEVIKVIQKHTEPKWTFSKRSCRSRRTRTWKID